MKLLYVIEQPGRYEYRIPDHVNKVMLLIGGGEGSTVLESDLYMYSPGERNFKKIFYYIDSSRIIDIFIGQGAQKLGEKGESTIIKIQRNGIISTILVHGGDSGNIISPNLGTGDDKEEVLDVITDIFKPGKSGYIYIYNDT